MCGVSDPAPAVTGTVFLPRTCHCLLCTWTTLPAMLPQVALKGVVSTVVVTTLVLEGWSSKLNPDIKIMDKLQELLPLSYGERVSKFISEFGSDREVVPSGL